MQRTLQLQILTWLAAMAVIGAITHPSVDTGLFAGAFVVGTMLLRIRESWKWAEQTQKRGSLFGRATLPEVRDLRVFGDAMGAAIAWGAALCRFHFAHVAGVPDRLDTRTLVLAATVPTAALVLRIVNAVRRRARLRRLDL